MQRHPSTGSQGRRKTLHCPQSIFLSHLDDIKNIDESTSDIYNIRESSSFKNLDEKNKTILHIQTNFDDIITINQHSDLLKVTERDDPNILKVAEKETSNLCPPKTVKENVLTIPVEQKPLHKLYGSSKHLFRQISVDICNEQTPFLLTTQQSMDESEKTEPVVSIELKLHDSQESVQRIISERRKLDDNLKEIDEFDIFERTDACKENSENRDVAQFSSSTVADYNNDRIVIAEDMC